MEPTVKDIMTTGKRGADDGCVLVVKDVRRAGE